MLKDKKKHSFIMTSLLNNYLEQQSEIVQNNNINTNTEIIPAGQDLSLQDFRTYVKKWLELDTMIKNAQAVIKEKKKIRDKLSVVIANFMCKYNIEDINTKEGRIKCKTVVSKSPVSQKVVKTKLADIFKDDEDKKNMIISKIYEERDNVEKLSLRRLKIT